MLHTEPPPSYPGSNAVAAADVMATGGSEELEVKHAYNLHFSEESIRKGFLSLQSFLLSHSITPYNFIKSIKSRQPKQGRAEDFSLGARSKTESGGGVLGDGAAPPSSPARGSGGALCGEALPAGFAAEPRPPKGFPLL